MEILLIIMLAPLALILGGKLIELLANPITWFVLLVLTAFAFAA